MKTGRHSNPPGEPFRACQKTACFNPGKSVVTTANRKTEIRYLLWKFFVLNISASALEIVQLPENWTFL
jgi:hypothetical protein